SGYDAGRRSGLGPAAAPPGGPGPSEPGKELPMPSESPTAVAAVPPAEAPAWPVLGLHEKRVLGVLVEKAKTTPDVYPLSVNALVTGCNQKSNRDPLLDLSDLEVEDVLVDLQKKGLAIKITGGRVI